MAPLDGVRVLDMSRLLPGPMASLLLASFGADVIKIELLPRGDPLRWRKDRPDEHNNAFDLVNHNKRSIAVNMRHPQGQELVRRLMGTADIFVESFRPGIAASMGLGFDKAQECNPRLIYASLSGFGQTGPLRQAPGHDINFLARSGVLSQMKDSNGRPVVPGAAIADVGAGAFLTAMGILLALNARERSGIGQHVDIGMLEGLLPFLAFPWSAMVNSGAAIVQTGLYACYNVYSAADGKYLALGMMEPKFWEGFCHLVHHSEWIGLQYDVDAQPQLMADVALLFKTRSRDAWLGELGDLDLCISPVLEFSEIFSDPHLNSRGMLPPLPSLEGVLQGFGVPIKLSSMTIAPLTPAPRLGEHTLEVLRAAGYDPASIETLESAGVLMRASGGA